MRFSIHSDMSGTLDGKLERLERAIDGSGSL